MSHREHRFEQSALRGESIDLYCDFDSGTWRLFVTSDNLCVDLSLTQLRELATNLNKTLSEIDADEHHNAEIVHAQIQEMEARL